MEAAGVAGFAVDAVQLRGRAGGAAAGDRDDFPAGADLLLAIWQEEAGFEGEAALGWGDEKRGRCEPDGVEVFGEVVG